MLSIQNIAKGTEIKQVGASLVISNPMITFELPVEVEYTMASKQLTNLVATITYLYLTTGPDRTKRIIEQIGKIKVL